MTCNKGKARRLEKQAAKQADHEARRARGVEIPPGPAKAYQAPKRKTWTEHYWHWIPNIVTTNAYRIDFKGNKREKEIRVQLGLKYVPIERRGEKVERPVPTYKDGTPRFVKPTLTEVVE